MQDRMTHLQRLEAEAIHIMREVVAEAEDGTDAVDAYANLRPDLILMDAQMPRVNGLEATKQSLKGNSDARV